MFDPDSKQIIPERTHECEAGERLRQATRAAWESDVPQALWRDAIIKVERAAGQWWAHNDEYSSMIRFCPWCGVDLEAEKPT